MQKKSFVRTIRVLMWIQMAVVSGLLLVAAVTFAMSAQREMRSVAENVTGIYSAQMENRLDNMREHLSLLLSEEADLGILGSADEVQRHYASVRLLEKMQNIMQIDQSADMLVIAQPDAGIFLDANNNTIPLDERIKLRLCLGELAETGNQSGSWQICVTEGGRYLYKASVRDGHVIAVVVSVESLMGMIRESVSENSCFVLTDGEGTVRGYSGQQLFLGETGIHVEELPAERMIVCCTGIEKGQLDLYCFVKKSDAFDRLYGSAVLIILIILLLGVIDLIFMRTEHVQLIGPMRGMVKDMEKMGSGDYTLRVEERGNNREFSMLAQTFNRLMDEIIHLKIQFYEKKLALGNAEQKYIRLQIRPHFFLNAMTTISSLSAKGKHEEIETYIGALSKNIRYMFSSGLHTVALKEEIRHVENYFEMQELRYPNCLFYFISVPPEAEEWRLPQMLLHTLVENEYKYGVSQDSSLVVLIRAELRERGGERMLFLEVEDDGRGYPEEVLDYMNGNAQKPEDGSRVGLWSIKRLLELMYDRTDLLELSNIDPHGARCRMYIPAEPANECDKEYLDERGIQ